MHLMSNTCQITHRPTKENRGFSLEVHFEDTVRFIVYASKTSLGPPTEIKKLISLCRGSGACSSRQVGVLDNRLSGA